MPRTNQGYASMMNEFASLHWLSVPTTLKYLGSSISTCLHPQLPTVDIVSTGEYAHTI